MNSDWVSVFASANQFEVRIIQGMLLDNEIHSVIVDKQDSMHIHLNVGTDINLHVAKNDVTRAKYLISQHSA